MDRALAYSHGFRNLVRVEPKPLAWWGADPVRTLAQVYLRIADGLMGGAIHCI